MCLHFALRVIQFNKIYILLNWSHLIFIIIILFTHGVQFTYRGLPWSRVLLLLTKFEFKTIRKG